MSSAYNSRKSKWTLQEIFCVKCAQYFDKVCKYKVCIGNIYIFLKIVNFQSTMILVEISLKL